MKPRKGSKERIDGSTLERLESLMRLSRSLDPIGKLLSDPLTDCKSPLPLAVDEQSENVLFLDVKQDASSECLIQKHWKQEQMHLPKHDPILKITSF